MQRHALWHVDVEGETTHKVHTVTELGAVGTELKVREVAEHCRPGTTSTVRQPPGVFDGCLLDDPKVTWEVGRLVQVANADAITRGVFAVALAGGLVYGNVECFSGGCGSGAKVAVGIGDGVLLGVVGIVAYLYTLSHYD